MVKRQREKQYQSAREHREYARGRSSSSSSAAAAASGRRPRRPLPFSHCALSLTPYETPVCTAAGVIFENSQIQPFLLKHKRDPVTGKPATSQDLITLRMSRNDEGRWQCPVLAKPFADHTKIVAVRSGGGNEANVYSWEAYTELNVKPNNYEDLLTGERFNKKTDVIVLNDPDDEEFNKMRDINTFYHILSARRMVEEGSNNKGLSGGDVRHSVTASRIMEKLQKQKDDAKRKQPPVSSSKDHDETPLALKRLRRDFAITAQDVTGVRYTTGQAAASLTSTGVAKSHDTTTDREATDEEILQAQFRVMRKRRKKGYVRLRTSHGDVTVELHCDIVPRTCTNFLGLCQAGAYDGSSFHRLIPGFMVQGGGSPEKNGQESSVWGGAVQDEFDERLQHKGAGVVSMANAGPNTAKQQFFVTFKSCPHLDRKHAVFGQVIDDDGLQVLKKLEQIPVDGKDRPKERIKILGTDVLADPAEEAFQSETKRLQECVRARQVEKKPGAAKKNPPSTIPAAPEPEVGRYLKAKLKKASSESSEKEEGATTVPSRLPPPPKKTVFGDFSGW